MTFVPFKTDLLDELLASGGEPTAPGLDGDELQLWHPSIGPDGEGGKEVIGAKVPAMRTVNWPDPLAPTVYHTASAYDRQYVWADLRQPDYDDVHERPDDNRQVVGFDAANVLSSALVDDEGKPTGFHTIAIDIDRPVRVRETDTPGHYHLFIDVPMPWEDYKAVLEALVNAGVVEEGYYRASVEREATMLRLPWVHKTPKPDKVDILDFVTASEPESAEIKLATPAPAELSWDADQYDVEYVNGKGVLRRRKA
jgi:hypothetical protein